MEWFLQLSVAWQTVIAYVGAICIFGMLVVLLSRSMLGIFFLIIAHPKMWIINTEGKRKRVWNFPYENEEFYAYMLKMNKNEKLLVTLKNHARSRYTERLFMKMVTRRNTILRTKESILTSTMTSEMDKYIVSSFSYEQRDWVLQVQEGEEETKYILLYV